MSAWFPIETIPQPVDGKAQFVLVYIPQPDAMGQNYEVTCATGFPGTILANVCYGLGGDIPTHWMPLPAPPDDESDENSVRLRIARAIAETYFGRPVEDEYLLGNCTGGYRFLECADAAIAAGSGTAKTPQAVECDSKPERPEGIAQSASPNKHKEGL